jgi:hypothetical protein
MHEGKTIVVHGTIGDTNALDYGGGVVYEVRGEDELIGEMKLAYFEPVDEDDEKSDIEVYREDLPDNVMAYYDWADWERVGDASGVSMEEKLESSTSSDPVVRAGMVQSLAFYFGWHCVDDYPLRMTREETESLYGQILDAPEGVPFVMTKEERA